jgi:PiT family inorganic phosphate transporter
MSMVFAVVLIALVFTYINGFHDTANSIATVVATKVLTPGQAVILAAGTNLVGAFWGTAVAKTIASGLIDTDMVTVTSQVILCALLGGIVWNLFTWWRGIPASSSHALIGGLCGAALAASHNNWHVLIWSQSAAKWTESKGLLWKVFVPMVSSPIAGFALGMLIMALLYLIIFTLNRAGGPLRRIARPRWVNAFFNKAQLLSAGYMGFAHGTNDAQKTMGIIALTIFGAGGGHAGQPAPLAGVHASAWQRQGHRQLDHRGLCAGDGRGDRRRWLAHHQDDGPQDGEAASDRWLRRGERFGDDPGDCSPFRHAGVDDPQHLDRDHGRGFRQEPARAEAHGDRADRVGVDPDDPGRGPGRLWAAQDVRAVRLGVSPDCRPRGRRSDGP